MRPRSGSNETTWFSIRKVVWSWKNPKLKIIRCGRNVFKKYVVKSRLQNSSLPTSIRPFTVLFKEFCTLEHRLKGWLYQRENRVGGTRGGKDHDSYTRRQTSSRFPHDCLFCLSFLGLHLCPPSPSTSGFVILVLHNFSLVSRFFSSPAKNVF